MSGVLAEMTSDTGREFSVLERKGGVETGGINLTEGYVNEEYVVREIRTADPELESFLFSLGCYKGEPLTIISALSEMYVISLKDARYSINRELAEAIIL